jgi:hypothetical protein
LAGLCQDGVGQERLGAVRRAATAGRDIALLPEESALGAMTAGACKSVQISVTRHPDEADAVIQPFGNGEIHHLGMIPHYAW